MNDKLLIDRTLLEQALDALLHRSGGSDQVQRIDAAITDLCAALAQQAEPAQEPVAWRHKGAGHFTVTPLVSKFPEWEPLYTAPPQRPPLTDEEIAEATAGVLGLPHEIKVELARAIERKVRRE